VQVERRDRGEPRDNPDRLPPEKEEDGPEEVEQQGRGHQDAQRGPGGDPLRAEADGKVPDEHELAV